MYFNRVKKIFIKNLTSLTDNINLLNTIFANESNNKDSLDLFDPLVIQNMKLLREINNNPYIYKNKKYFKGCLETIRTSLNKINYIIRFNLIYSYLNSTALTNIDTNTNFQSLFGTTNLVFNSTVTNTKTTVTLEDLYIFDILEPNYIFRKYDMHKDTIDFLSISNDSIDLYDNLVNDIIRCSDTMINNIDYIKNINESNKINYIGKVKLDYPSNKHKLNKYNKISKIYKLEKNKKNTKNKIKKIQKINNKNNRKNKNKKNKNNRKNKSNCFSYFSSLNKLSIFNSSNNSLNNYNKIVVSSIIEKYNKQNTIYKKIQYIFIWIQSLIRKILRMDFIVNFKILMFFLFIVFTLKIKKTHVDKLKN